MKLIKCHVSSFGILTDFGVDFNEGLNSYLRKNGEGKSTLAAFIKVMLYGMDTTTTRSAFDDRKHYLPFSGGYYGGSLTIDYKGKEYTIARKFDDKSKTKDQLKITDNLGNEVLSIEGTRVDKDFPAGDILVGINEEAFKKCNFIYSNDLNFEINDSIKMKLNDLIVDLSKEKSYSEVMENIEADLKLNRENAKNYGSTYQDKVKQCKKENEELNQKIRVIQGFEGDLLKAYERFNQLQRKIDEIKIKKQELNMKNIEKENWDTLTKMVANLKPLQDKLEELKNKYKEGMISNQDLIVLEKMKDQAVIIQNDIDKYKESYDDKFFIDSYNKRYRDDKIDQEFYETLNSEYVSISGQESTKGTYEKPNIEKLILLDKKFNVESILPIEKVKNDYSDYKYDKEKLEQIEKNSNEILRKVYPKLNDIEESNEKLKQYKQKRHELSSIENSYKEPSTFLRILLIIFTLGIYLVISKKKKKEFNNTKNKLSKEVLEISVELDAIFNKFEIEGTDYNLKLQRLISLESVKNTDNKAREIDILNSNVAEKEDNLKKYFSRFGHDNENVELSYDAYVNEYSDYKILLEKKKQYDNQIGQVDIEVTKRKERLNETLNKYFPFEHSITEKLNKLRADIGRKIDYDEKTKKLTDAESKMEDNNQKIQAILDRNSIPYDKDIKEIYSILLADTNEYITIDKSLKERKEEIEKFKKEKGLTINVEVDVSSAIAELEAEEEQVKAEASSYDTRIKEIETEVAREEDYNSKIQENLDLITSYEQEIDIIEKAKRFILSAEQNLEEKYLTPIKTKFDNYSNLIKKEFGVNTKMNFDYNITREVNGQIVGTEYLSDGEKTILMLALRFAVIDNLYKDNDTFVILDDPLIFLDSDNLVKSKNVIKELAKNKQIIYFSCHDSRNIW